MAESIYHRHIDNNWLTDYAAFLILSMFAGCGPSNKDLQGVEYTPLIRNDWEVSRPEEQGLDPMLVAGCIMMQLSMQQKGT